MRALILIAFILDSSNAGYLYDDGEETMRSRVPTFDEVYFEPLMPLPKDREKLSAAKNINCDDFSKYALNCTVEAALIYNSSRKCPPMPAKIGEWCSAIRHLTNCAIDWNADCKDVTENRFNEESIKGHMHVVNNVCDDESFLTQYDDLPQCIEQASEPWESCYSQFKVQVDEQKNTSHEWTHFNTHFYLCCARAKFRRCTLEALFETSSNCQREQAVTLQKFSVIVSEGDVFQDCEHNMMYSNCPGGDPRPPGNTLVNLMKTDYYNTATKTGLRQSLWVTCIFVINILY